MFLWRRVSASPSSSDYLERKLPTMQFCFSVGSNNSGSRRHLCEKENFQIRAFEIKAAAEKIKVTWTNKFKDTRTILKTWNLICLLLYFAAFMSGWVHQISKMIMLVYWTEGFNFPSVCSRWTQRHALTGSSCARLQLAGCSLHLAQIL